MLLETSLWTHSNCAKSSWETYCTGWLVRSRDFLQFLGVESRTIWESNLVQSISIHFNLISTTFRLNTQLSTRILSTAGLTTYSWVFPLPAPSGVRSGHCGYFPLRHWRWRWRCQSGCQSDCLFQALNIISEGSNLPRVSSWVFKHLRGIAPNRLLEAVSNSSNLQKYPH